MAEKQPRKNDESRLPRRHQDVSSEKMMCLSIREVQEVLSKRA